MLIEFTVGNFKSFKEPTTFSMVAAAITSKDKTLDHNNVFEATSKLKLLKSAAIYGANASGKSNLVKALAFMQNFIINSASKTQVNDPIEVEIFRLHRETEGKPASFEVVFMLEGIQYRYGFEATTKRIVAEWLYYTPTVREAVLFTRDLEGFHFPKSSKFAKEAKGLEARTRDNALFLSVVAQFNGEIAVKIIKWFRSLIIMSGLVYSSLIVTSQRSNEYNYEENVTNFLKNFDLGFEEINLDKTDLEPGDLKNKLMADFSKKQEEQGRRVIEQNVRKVTIQTKHYKHGNAKNIYELFDMAKNESAGTQKLFALAAPIMDALLQGRTLIIDEFDSSLHIILSRKIIEIFNSNRTNPHNAQLVVATHDTNLLDNRLFRRDQIWFTEKDRYSATKLYSLAEFQVRNDASFEKDYIQGRYGAIPYVGNLAQVLEDSYATHQ